ncbi:hypothetical protein SDC9_167790 [bioreactor metagenome]|uniref:Uncharacterized protein n=1 Tax=bioreactor metagenome TaxID=1076179 RepID=A0A645G0Q9_9ZZZZ
MHIQDCVQIAIVLVLALPFLGVDLKTVFCPQRFRHRIIRGQGVAACEPDLGPSLCESDGQHPGLGLRVKGHAHLQTLEGFLLRESFPYLHERRHMLLGPVQLCQSLPRQLVHLPLSDISDSHM